MDQFQVNQFQLKDLGWDSYFESRFEPWVDQGFVPGRVTVQHRGGCVLLTELGELRGEVAGRLRHDSVRSADLPATGDWVVARPRAGEQRATIHGVLERRSKFSRNVAGFATGEQVLAANVDIVFVMASLNADLNARRLERYLTMAWAGGANPVIVLTKADLWDDVGEAMDKVVAVAQGVPVHVTSSVTGEGLGDLFGYFAGSKTIALLGSSGIGKSSLVNALAGDQVQDVRAIRSDDRGRHTTTRRELVLLPGGGLILDTPGMRELQLWDDEGAIGSTFDDITQLAARCRFRDCKHSGEPGCAVTAAIAGGELPADRLRSYNKLQRELIALAARRDKKARSDQRKKRARQEKARRR